MEELAVASRIAAGMILMSAGLAKMRHPSAFLSALVDYVPLPAILLRAAGALLIPAELLLGGALLTGVGLPLSALAALALITLFAGALSLNLLRHRDVPCLCFGVQSAERTSPRGLIRLALLAGAVLLSLLPGPVSGPPDALNMSSFLRALLLGLLSFGLLAVGAWVLAVPELIHVWRAQARSTPIGDDA